VKITGIIAEYNPFHNGHKYQIQEAKKFSDSVVVIMSGSFVQRGSIAITDKWTRAKIAAENGADLVLELPVIYSLNTAQRFAKGAVDILDKTNLINYLCFGSESGNVEELTTAAELLINEPAYVSEKIKKFIAEGISYPSARQKAFEGLIDEEILSSPNNILALEYIKALIEIGSSIEPVTVKRYGTDYHDAFSKNGIASASAIRNMIQNQENINDLTPDDSFEIYDENKLNTALIAHLRMMSEYELSCINDVNEGLENRIKKALTQSLTIDELCENIKTKRYPMSRIRRIAFSSLLGITKEIAESNVNYIRVLAMNSTGAGILKEIKNKSTLDIITKTADYQKNDIAFQKDILATDIFALCCNKKIGIDYIKSPIKL